MSALGRADPLRVRRRRDYLVSTLGLEPEPFLLSLLARSTYLSKNRIASA